MLLVSDFDGTLNRGGVSEKDAAAVRLWQDAGHKFVIATGRGTEFAPTAAHDLPFVPDAMIGCNGALFFDREGRLTRSFTLPGETEVKLSALAGEYGCLSCHPARDGIDADRFCTLTVYFPDIAQAKAYAARVQRDVPGLTCYQYSTIVTVVGADTTKATGVARLAEAWGVEPTQIRTVGDSFNDFAMLEQYRGFAIRGSELGAFYARIAPDVAWVCARLLSKA